MKEEGHKEEKEFINKIMLPLFNSPEHMRLSRKAMNNPDYINTLTQLPIPGIGKVIDDLKDLFDEDNVEEFNDLKQSLENLKNENNNKLNEEDKKKKNPIDLNPIYENPEGEL